MSVMQTNLVCANGHSFYSPTPERYVTTDANQRFCTANWCYGRKIPIRRTDGDFEYVSPLSANPPQEIIESWLDS